MTRLRLELVLLVFMLSSMGLVVMAAYTADEDSMQTTEHAQEVAQPHYFKRITRNGALRKAAFAKGRKETHCWYCPACDRI